MKKLILLFLIAIVTFGTAQQAEAQVKLNVFGGYTFQDQFNINGYYNGYSYQQGQIDAGAHFGAALEFFMEKNSSVELLWQHQSTVGRFHTSALEYGPFDVNVDYIMIGGVRYAPFSPVVSGYGGINLGMGLLGGEVTDTKFAFGGKLGLLINASKSVGIKLGAQVLSPVQGAGGGFYLGTGGAGAGVSTYSSIYQFGFTGGLCFTFPDRSVPPPPAGGVTY